MNILIVQTGVFNPKEGGVQRVTFNLGRYFSQQGLKVAYFSFKHKRHISVKYGQLYHANESGGVNNQININELKNCINQFRPDRVVNQMPYDKKLRDALAQFGTSFNFKLIGCIHNSLFNYKSNIRDVMRRKLPKPFNQIMATETMSKLPLLYHKIKHRADLIEILKAHDITLLFTPANYEELKYFLRPKELEGASIDFMPNPVMHIEQEVPKKEKIILHVGRLNIQQKRSDLLLDFWENVYQDLPDWEFKVLGDGPYYENLMADLKKRDLPRIELLGFQKPEPYYKEAAIFMMPSAYEGLPNTILEAHSFGCPVLAFNSYAALECIVDDGKNALLVKPYDTHQMAKLCIDLAKNDSTLEKMQISALQNAHRFAIQKVGSQWLSLFEKLI
jgi:glycosyltransferase involved in cell wall biosynthesis